VSVGQALATKRRCPWNGALEEQSLGGESAAGVTTSLVTGRFANEDQLYVVGRQVGGEPGLPAFGRIAVEVVLAAVAPGIEQFRKPGFLSACLNEGRDSS
jgi:hypothetical protein